GPAHPQGDGGGPVGGRPRDVGAERIRLRPGARRLRTVPGHGERASARAGAGRPGRLGLARMGAGRAARGPGRGGRRAPRGPLPLPGALIESPERSGDAAVAAAEAAMAQRRSAAGGGGTGAESGTGEGSGGDGSGGYGFVQAPPELVAVAGPAPGK